MLATQSDVTIQSNHSMDMIHWSDQALIDSIIAHGETWRDAFSILMARHKIWIFRRCLYRLGHIHNAEDAAHDVMLRAYQGLQGFQGRSSFRTWLGTVTDNYCNSFAVRHARYDLCEHIEQLIERQDKPNTEWLEDEHSVINRVMSDIPAAAQEVLTLRFYCDYSLEDIANALDLNLSAAKARLYRALALFKQRYLEVNAGLALPAYI